MPHKVFEDHVVPAHTTLEARGRYPTTFLVWAKQARTMATTYCIAYGWEWDESLSELLGHLCQLHEADVDRFPLGFIQDAWEELFWRQGLELRQGGSLVLRGIGKDTVRKEEFVSAARTPVAGITPGQ